MSKLVLIGGGGHCKSVLDAALSSRQFEEIVITDNQLYIGSEILGCKVVGTDDYLRELHRIGFEYAFISVGSITSCHLRIRLAKLAEEIGFRFPVICDPSSRISLFSSLGKGSFVGKNAVVNADSIIGQHCIINSGSIIEHDCKVGDFSHISVGSVLCGNVSVGNECFIGAGSTVIQGLSIGNKSIIGAHSTVLSNVEENQKKFGIVHNPKIDLSEEI